jgi:hypothetical protein
MLRRMDFDEVYTQLNNTRGICHFKIQGGSNMTGTDFFVNVED